MGTPSKSWPSSTGRNNSGVPAPVVSGSDELSSRQGHAYRIVVSELVRRRPLCFGGQDRSKTSLAESFAWLGPKKCRKIRVAVRDRWQAFRNATRQEGQAPQATSVFDKFQVLRHLGEALDQVRQQAYARLVGAGRRFIKGQKYAWLARWHNLTSAGRKGLQLLFKANQRLNTAYLLQESFDQLGD
jgi:transposase